MSQISLTPSALKQSIDNLDEIVDEVPEYVHNKKAEPVQSREWIEIQPEIDPMINFYRLESPKLRFEWQYSGSPQATDVYADRISLHRVIGNLLSDAIRFARAIVRIQVPRVAERNPHNDPKSPLQDMLCIDVEDDGSGIPKDRREAILAPFVRLTVDDDISENTISSYRLAIQVG